MAHIEPPFLYYMAFLLVLLTSLTSCLPNPAPTSDVSTDNNTVPDTTNSDVPTPNQQVTCYPVQELPSDFHCHDALQQMVADFSGPEPFRLTHLPTLPLQKWTLRVPHTWNSGSCDIVLTTVNRLPDVRAYSPNLRTWASLLISRCVRDESHTGGGLLRVDYEGSILFRGNALTIEAKLKPYSDNATAEESGDSPGIMPVGSGSVFPSVQAANF